MTQEDKKLLLIDLFSRMPYGVRVKIFDKDILSYENNEKGTLDGKETISGDNFVIKCDNDSWIISCDDFKPYLRPMSSMTEEEISSLSEYTNCNIAFNREDIKNSMRLLDGATLIDNVKASDWLNSHHFDYHGLIEKGLALEATEDMYKKNKTN